MKFMFTSLLLNKLVPLVVLVLLMGIPISDGFSQTRISGTVEDQSSVLLPGVSVLVVGTTTGTVTDIDGRFDLMVPVGSDRISFSFIGF